MKFKVILEDAEEGGYTASCPALPGCHSQGDTIEQAIDNIKEAIVGCLESLNEEKAKAFSSQAKVVEVTV
jgi:predicted RNase H-like HicB family nuclease